MSQVVLYSVLLSTALSSEPVRWTYLPGDAFFRVSLTKKIAHTLASEPTIKLTYSRGSVWVEEDVRPTPGYLYLEMTGVSVTTSVLVQRIYYELRQHHPLRQIIVSDATQNETPEEMNGFPLLIYNQDFDCVRNEIGLRYNEGWGDDLLPFLRYPGNAREMLFYEVGDPSLQRVIVDFRDGVAVAPLKAQLPRKPFPDKFGRELAPIAINADAVKIVIVEDQDIGVQRKAVWPSRMYVVTSERAEEWSYRDRNWEVELFEGADNK